MKGYLKSRTSERATFASQPSKPSNFRKPSKASKPTKNGKSLFYEKKSMIKNKKKANKASK